MAQQEDDQAALWRECEQEVERLLTLRGWKLVAPESLARRAHDVFVAGTASTVQRAAVHAYVQALHAACSGAEGAERQNLGYQELFAYLLDMARRRYHEIAEETAQLAVEQTFARFASCRAAGAFLAFASQQLLAAARNIRQEIGVYSSAHAAVGQSPAALAALADPDSDDLDAPVIAAELRERFERLTGLFLAKHPRAARQLTALRMKYVDEADDQTIAEQLGVSVSGVYVLRSRAIEKLREEPDWRALAAEFGIVAED